VEGLPEDDKLDSLMSEVQEHKTEFTSEFDDDDNEEDEDDDKASLGMQDLYSGDETFLMADDGYDNHGHTDPRKSFSS
jgi:hypothetical protein